MNKLLIISDNASEYASYLQDYDLPCVEICVARNMDAAESFIDQANIILGKPAMTAPLLERATKLEWLQSTFAGIEPFCAAGLRNDYILTGVKDVFGPLMSEYVFAYLLALERHLFSTRDNQHKKLWQAIPYRSLSELTIGICGLGSIGQAIANTAAHFRMRVLGLSRSATPVPSIDEVFATSEITDFASQVDYLVVVLPGTPQTTGLINREVFQAMSTESVLVSVGRGASIDEASLTRAMRNRDIRAAVLDVFNTEPLSKDSPLWEMDNVFITPHNAAISFASDIAAIFQQNYHRFISGQPLNYVIDFKRGY
jgi:phosphoglycerate dehydrogenase-like enzyme